MFLRTHIWARGLRFRAIINFILSIPIAALHTRPAGNIPSIPTIISKLKDRAFMSHQLEILVDSLYVSDTALMRVH